MVGLSPIWHVWATIRQTGGKSGHRRTLCFLTGSIRENTATQKKTTALIYNKVRVRTRGKSSRRPPVMTGVCVAEGESACKLAPEGCPSERLPSAARASEGSTIRTVWQQPAKINGRHCPSPPVTGSTELRLQTDSCHSLRIPRINNINLRI